MKSSSPHCEARGRSLSVLPIQRCSIEVDLALITYYDALRNADQIRFSKFYAGTFVTLIKQHINSLLQTFCVQLVAGAAHHVGLLVV